MSVNDGGTTHHLIFGFGVVSVNSGTNHQAEVVNSNVLGLHISNGPGLKMGVGYASQSVVSISTNANVVIEVDRRPGKPLKVNAQ